MTIAFTNQQLLGQCESHLSAPENIAPEAGIAITNSSKSRHQLHTEVIADWLRLQKAAKADGINLQIASSFRSFDRQLAIWNAKASGQRVLNDRNNNPLNFESLTEQQLLNTILTWSALPGASRHHWGCDLDVYDPDMLQQQSLQLEPREYQAGGPMAKLGQWLSANIKQYGFYQPYRTDKGGVAIEPWHISHVKVACLATKQLTHAVLTSALVNCDIRLKSQVLSQLPKIFSQYIENTDQP